MKFAKFFDDFTSGYAGGKEDRDHSMTKRFIQFDKLKKVLKMISVNNNQVDVDKLTEEDTELAKTVGNDATLLFVAMLESQIKIADVEYCSRMAALPKRLQVAFKMSMVRNVPDGETTSHDGALFSVNSFKSGDGFHEQPEETQTDKLAAYLEPMGEFFYMVAEETM